MCQWYSQTDRDQCLPPGPPPDASVWAALASPLVSPWPVRPEGAGASQRARRGQCAPHGEAPSSVLTGRPGRRRAFCSNSFSVTPAFSPADRQGEPVSWPWTPLLSEDVNALASAEWPSGARVCLRVSCSFASGAREPGTSELEEDSLREREAGPQSWRRDEVDADSRMPREGAAGFASRPSLSAPSARSRGPGVGWRQAWHRAEVL